MLARKIPLQELQADKRLSMAARKEYTQNVKSHRAMQRRFATQLGREEVFSELVGLTQSQLIGVLKRLKITLSMSDSMAISGAMQN